MKQTHYLVIALIILISVTQSCKKNASPKQTTDQELIQSAKAYFENEVEQTMPAPSGNNRIKADKAPYWQGASAAVVGNMTLVIVPVFYKKDLVVSTNFSGNHLLSLNALTNLIIFKDSAGFGSELVTYFPDSTIVKSASSPFSGIIFTESWNGAPIHKYKTSQGLTLTETTTSNQTDQSATPKMAASAKETTGIVAECTTIYGYNYSAEDPDDSYAWSEPSGCDYEYLMPDPIGRGVPAAVLAGLSARPFLSLAVVVPPPNNIVANIQDYFKCFSNYGGSDHTYQVTVCVDQPDPGTREAWALTSTGIGGSSSGANPVDVGHTYLVLSENFAGYSIVRNIGFYPQTNVTPWSPSAQGQLNDDDGHPYSISLTINVDNGQFFNILNYISQGNNAGYMYDLNTNNCTSFVLHAAEAGNIDLPSTVGSWPDGGFGYDPGDLGEDIRNMQLSSNMTRSTNYSDHPNQYNCN